MTHRLQVKLLNQAGSLPNVYYQEVLDNLAMIEADPTRMPYFSDPQTARMGIQQSVNGSNRVDWELVSTAPTGVLNLFDRFLFSRESATTGASRSESGEWSAVTDNDPDKLFTMRAAYHSAAGIANAEDREILREFYYRHFMITSASERRLQQESPQVFAKVADRLKKLEDIEYLTSEDFEARLKDNDVLGRDDAERFRRPILKACRMDQEPNEFVSDEDTHHLLYLEGLNQGWFHTGKKQDVPKNAAFKSQYGKLFVWVMPDQVEMLTRMTFAILDIHTSKSARLGGSRVQPGIVVR